MVVDVSPSNLACRRSLRRAAERNGIPVYRLHLEVPASERRGTDALDSGDDLPEESVLRRSERGAPEWQCQALQERLVARVGPTRVSLP